MKFEIDPDRTAAAVERAATSLHKNAVGLALVLGAMTGLGAVVALIFFVLRFPA